MDVSGGVSRSGHIDYTFAYDPSAAPGQHDVTTDPEGEEVAVAIFRNGQVFAFSTESYRYPTWGNPAWQLDLKQIYRIVVRVHGEGVRKRETFTLDCLAPNAANFRLVPVKSSPRWKFWKRR
jgi:hypothetical protein